MQQDRFKWDQRYAAKAAQRPGIPKILQQQWQQLNAGSVLDVASGDGAAALFLAEQGFTVTATDISDQGLQRLAGFAAELGVSVTSLCADFDAAEDREKLQQAAGEQGFDNIVISYFKPQAELLCWLASLLAKDGKLWLATFNLRQHEQQGFSKRFCLSPDEFRSIAELPESGLELLEYQQHNDEQGGIDSYLFSRRQ